MHYMTLVVLGMQALLQQQYDQNCIANPLYDGGCHGYATAYLNQQCTINPLYSSSCSGYAKHIIHNNVTWIHYMMGLMNILTQCKDPLYDITCQNGRCLFRSTVLT